MAVKITQLRIGQPGRHPRPPRPLGRRNSVDRPRSGRADRVPALQDAERAAWDYIERADGSTQLTTVLPGAIFGPALTADNFGSVQTLSRMLEGRVPRYPSLAFEVVDVRDVADLHIRAMIAPEAEGERLIATGELLWMGEMAAILREQLGPAAAKVPAKPMPDLLVRVAAPFNPELRTLLPLLGRKLRHSSAKAQRMLGWLPRPAADTVVDSGRSIVGWSSDL